MQPFLVARRVCRQKAALGRAGAQRALGPAGARRPAGRPSARTLQRGSCARQPAPPTRLPMPTHLSNCAASCREVCSIKCRVFDVPGELAEDVADLLMAYGAQVRAHVQYGE